MYISMYVYIYVYLVPFHTGSAVRYYPKRVFTHRISPGALAGLAHGAARCKSHEASS